MLHAITVVSLGPGAPELMTLGTERCLRGPGKADSSRRSAGLAVWRICSR